MDYDDDYDGAERLAYHLTARNRPLRMFLRFADGPADDVLLPQRIDGFESICDGIELRIYCLALDAHIRLKTLIGLPVEVQIVTDRGTLRRLCGIVAEASRGESDGGLASYQLVMRDGLAILDLDINSRVFFNKTELQVVQTVLGELASRNPTLATTFGYEVDTALGLHRFPRRSQIIQCNESTGAFVRRLLRRRGIGWYFRAGSAGQAPAEADGSCVFAHTMVMFQDTQCLPRTPAGSVRFHRDSATEESDTLTAWSALRALRPARVTRFSWDYAKTWASAFMTTSARGATDQGEVGNELAAGLDRYLVEAPHVRDNYEDLSALAWQNMARQDFEAKCYYAEGGLRDCSAGQYFCFDGHPDLDGRSEDERSFVVLSQHITAQNNLPKEFDARVARLFSRNRWNTSIDGLALVPNYWFGDSEMRFVTRMTCVRRDIRFVPAWDPRTDLPQPQMQCAVVVGPAGEPVGCDELGRVRVSFAGMRPADHAHASGMGASGTDGDSAWVRVASNWAGSTEQFGALSLPRAGTEVLIAFLGGDPDKPVIIGQLYNVQSAPPRLGQDGLPGNRYLSGMKSAEIRGRRANQLRLDDTPGQISAQLASDHGQSELNLGWLTEPRVNGAGKARGEGAELRTDGQLALRAGKGMLLSAWQRLGGAGAQLERADYLALMEECVALFRSLGQCAAEQGALAVDDSEQDTLHKALGQWESGSNTAPAASGGGAAAIGVSAPDGLSFASSRAIVSYAAAHIDTVAGKNLQMTAGQRYTLNAGRGISLFAQQDGMALIAQHGRTLMQSQHGDTRIESGQDIRIGAHGRVTIMAEEIALVNSAGAYLSLKGGNIEMGGPGALTVSTDGHNWNGPASRGAELPSFGESQFSRTPRLVRGSDGLPVEGMKLRVMRDGASAPGGATDAAGEHGSLKGDRLEQIQLGFYRPDS